jgi:hypothetical protein
MKDITIQIAHANFALDSQYLTLTNSTDRIKNRTVHDILCKVSDMVDPNDDYFDYDLDSDDLYKLQDEIITSVRDILTACINSNNQ